MAIVSETVLGKSQSCFCEQYFIGDDEETDVDSGDSELSDVTSDAETDLERSEEELTLEVPALFEKMNQAMEELNSSEAELGNARARHRALLSHWADEYKQARAQCGEHIDRAKPYFEAEVVLQVKARQAQRASRRFSLATTRHEEVQRGLPGGDCSAERRKVGSLAHCQTVCGRFQLEHVQALFEYKEAKTAVERLAAQAGSKAVARAMPFFAHLRKHQMELATEQRRIVKLEETVRASKALYVLSMSELERISGTVHAARQEHKAQSVSPDSS